MAFANFVAFFNLEEGIGKGNEYTGGADIPLYRRCSNMGNNKKLVNKIIKDMQNDGMIDSGNFMNCTMTVEGIYAKRTTIIGDDFLSFITD